MLRTLIVVATFAAVIFLSLAIRPPPATEPPSGGQLVTPPERYPAIYAFPHRLALDPGVPLLVPLHTEQLVARPPPVDVPPLNATMDAYQLNGGVFGLMVKPTGNGTGFEGRGTHVAGRIASLSNREDFVFYAKADREIDVSVTYARWTSTRQLAVSPENGRVPITGGGDHLLAIPADALLIELRREGTGTIVLRDPSGQERARLDVALDAWALADRAGPWVVSCEAVCVGDVVVTVTRTAG